MKTLTTTGLMFAATLTFSQTTVNIEPPLQDAFIYQANPSNNYCTSPNLTVGKDVNGYEARVLIKWDLSSLPNCITIVNAQIRLNDNWCDPNIGGGFYRITQSWSECSATWNNQPTIGNWYGTQTFSCGLTFTPATNLVQDWLTYGNNGVMIKWEWGSNGDIHNFESKEASGSNPRLIITYTTLTPPSVSVSSQNENCNKCDGTATANVSGGATPYTYFWSSGQTTSTITGLCSGTYTVTITDANGCTATSSASVSNISGPSSSVSSTQNETCNNSNGEICVSVSGGTTPYTYSWSNSQTSSCATGLSSGTYSVTVNDANNCFTSASGTISNVGQLSVAQFTASQTIINKGDCINFTDQSSNNPTSWSWTFSGGNPSSSTLQNLTNICYNTVGNYQASLTVSNSCGSDTESKINYIVVNLVNSIEDFNFSNSIKIYPNPVNDKIIVQLEKSETATIILFNIFGEKIFEKDFSEEIEINFSEYSEGVYFLSLQTEKGIFRERVAIVR